MISKEKINNKMHALVLNGIGDLSYEVREIPQIKPNEVLLKIKSCGICSSDIERIFVNGTYHFPTIPGHEFAGEIVSVYDEKDANLLGRKACVFPLLPCKTCKECHDENYAQCQNYKYYGSRNDGAYAEYLAVDKWNLVFFDNLDYCVASLCEPTAVAIHAANRITTEKEDSVLIIGGGTIGLLLALVLKTKSNHVYVGARNQKSMTFIKSLGLNYLDTNDLANEVNKATNGQGFNNIFEVVGSNVAINESIESAASFAKIVLVGNPKDDVALEKKTYWKILRKQLTLTGTWNSSYSSKQNDWQVALRFLKENEDVAKKLITHKYSLSESNEAFDTLRDKSIFKVKVAFEINKERGNL